MRNRNVRAAEYRRLAGAAKVLADASVLAHVREKHEHAAATWTALAEMDERPDTLDPTATGDAAPPPPDAYLAAALAPVE